MKIQPKNRKLGILLSGRGSNFEAIVTSIAYRSLEAEISVVISNVETAPGLARARELGIPTAYVPSKGNSREQFDSQLLEILQSHDVGLVILAGFMRIVGRSMIEAYPNLILNIHPALLPSFPGLDVQKQALLYGVKIAGCTVHIVSDTVDGGPIVLQAAVPVENDDSVEVLSARILKEEHRIYSQAIALLLSGHCELQGRRIIVRD